MKPKDLPKKIKPISKRAMFKINVTVPGVTGKKFAATMAIPVTPPKEKLLGNLKMFYIFAEKVKGKKDK